MALPSNCGIFIRHQRDWMVKRTIDNERLPSYVRALKTMSPGGFRWMAASSNYRIMNIMLHKSLFTVNIKRSEFARYFFSSSTLRLGVRQCSSYLSWMFSGSHISSLTKQLLPIALHAAHPP